MRARRAALCCGLLALAALGFAASAEDGAARWGGEGPQAATTIDFPDLRDEAHAGRPVPIKLHLAATTAAAGALPIVILSHGAGGSRDANFAQAHHLASYGYAVLAVEHPGSGTARLLEGGRYAANLNAMTRDAAEVLGRPLDVRFAIDMAERWNRNEPHLKGRLDLQRIGMLGHSFGAYTTLVACGARPLLDWLQPPPGRGLAHDMSDPRIKACVALSPQGPGEPYFNAASYATIDRPLLGITGSRDQAQTGPPENRRRSFELLEPSGNHAFIWLDGADHSAFSDPSGSGRRGLPSPSRDDAQPLVRAATLRFFDWQLRGDAQAEADLSQAALAPLLRGRITALEVLRK